MKRILAILVFAACSGPPQDGPPSDGTNDGSGSGSGSDASRPGTHGDVSAGCKTPLPAGAHVAAAPKTYPGTCPTIPHVTTQDVVITSSGVARKFWVVVPDNYTGTEKLPVMFLWHWLGADAQEFFDRGNVQLAVNQQQFIAIIPQAKGDLQFTWPATQLDPQPRMDEDATFFDNMLSCVSAQFNVDPNCVSSAGVSAGALWTDQLIGMRGDYIASFMSLSGGTGGLAIKPWRAPAHKLPGFVLWGGPTDNCAGLLNFADLSHDLEMNMKSGGHFVVECIHNCGHSVPPFEASGMSTALKPLWQFGLDHPFWLDPGESPYESGLPADMPAWCGLGMGGATPRTDVCIDPSQC